MLRRAPLKRTPWPRKSGPGSARAQVSESKPAHHGVEYAREAIKKIVKCGAVMAQMVGSGPTPYPKAPKPWRSESYRRLVASLECYHCRLHGHSQAAHPNTGKAKGMKACDSLVFPMCNVGGKDCHAAFDQYKLVSRADMPAFEAAALRWTVATLRARGQWPKINQPPALVIIA